MFPYININKAENDMVPGPLCVDSKIAGFTAGRLKTSDCSYPWLAMYRVNLPKLITSSIAEEQNNKNCGPSV